MILKRSLKLIIAPVMGCLAVLISCFSPFGGIEREGDPAIVAEYDFAKAWAEAVPTTGAIIELDSVYLVDKTELIYATSSINVKPGGHIIYEYDTSGYTGSANVTEWFLDRISDRAIVNDLGDTLFEFTFESSERKNVSVYKLGFVLLYGRGIDLETGGVGQSYLYEVEDEPYDLMATMRSTYNSIKYLQTLYPDSLIPFSVFEN